MAVVIICEKYGWTYQKYIDEYLKQPFWFLELSKIKTIIDKEKNE